MPVEQTQTIERFAFEGLLSLANASCLAIAIAALAGWLLWRERELLGRFWAASFWLLRIVAIAAVFWMLLGPTRQTVHRSTSPQSIAVVVDASESMDETDPEMLVDDARWALASSGDESVITACDRAAVSLAMAAESADQLTLVTQQHQALTSLGEKATAAGEHLDRAADLLIASSYLLEPIDTQLADRNARILSLVEGPAAEALQAIEEEATLGERASLTDLYEVVSRFSEVVNGAHRRAVLVSSDVARRQATEAALAQTPTRREKAQGLVQALEQGPLKALRDECRIHRIRFDHTITPLADEQWELTAADDLVTPIEYGSQGNAELRNAYAAESAAAIPAESPEAAARHTTDLAGTLQRLAELRATEPLRMVLLVSDGRHNTPDTPAPQDIAAQLEGVPVHVAVVGVTKPARDVLIHRVEAPTAVVLEDQAVIEVMLTAFDCRDEKLHVTIRHEGEEIDRKTVVVDRDRVDRRIEFRVPAEELGFHQYDIEIEPLADEASLPNNISTIAVEVVRDKLRVLLADRGPRYEYRYLQQLFRRDEHVEFDEYLTLPQLRTTGALEATGQLPSDADGWSRYDVVILGDLSPDDLDVNQQEALAEYIEEGGNLVLIAGCEYMPQGYRLQPLMNLAPVEEASAVDSRVAFAVTLASATQQPPAIMIRDTLEESRQAWESTYRLMPLYGISRYCRPKPNAEVLLNATMLDRPGQSARLVLENQSRAFCCWSQIGAGRVAYLAAPQSYLLRFRRGDRDHHRFWGQLLRWITATQTGAGSQWVRIETDRNLYERGQPVEVTVWLSDEQGRPLRDAELAIEAHSLGDVVAQVTMQADGGVPGRYVGSLDRLPTGAFEIVPTGPTVSKLIALSKQEAEEDAARVVITVQASKGIELINTQANRPLLQQIAELTGGLVLPPTAADEVFRLTALDPEVNETIQREPLWNRWSNLVLVLGCLCIEWIVRKQKGFT